MKPFAPPPAIDLLAQAASIVRAHLFPEAPIKQRIRTWWAGFAAARDLGASDVVEAEFLTLATEAGIAADLGRHAGETLAHVRRWALRGDDPFE